MRKRRTQAVLLCVALVTFGTVAWTGLSNFLRQTDPALAVAVNPLNIEARVDLVTEVLAGEGAASPQADAPAIARQSIRYAPIDARAYSQLAEVHLRDGETAVAAQLFNTALGLSQADWLALQRTLRLSIENADYAGALAKFDMLFRRWPEQSGVYGPIMPTILQDATGYDQALAVLKTDPPWRGRFLEDLHRRSDSVDLVYRLQLDLNAGDDTDNVREIAGAIRSLQAAGRHDLAYRLFLFTQSDTDRLNAGLIFNGAFNLEPSGRPFDWSIRNSPGVSIAREARATAGATGTAGATETAMTIRFLDKPVREIGFSQTVVLPPGRYRLSIAAGASNLRAPRGLHWELACKGPRAVLARLEVPEGDYRDRLLETDFRLPEGACNIAELRLRTDLTVESFRYRYSGALRLHSVSLSRLPP